METLVVVFDLSADELTHVYAVQHDGEVDFKDAWNKALKKAQDANPEEWMLDDVLKILRQEGWAITEHQYVEVAY